MFDLRTAIYRSVKILAAAALLAAGLKIAFVDVVRCAGSSMEPTILHGDRVLVFTTKSKPVVRRWSSRSYGKTIIFKSPFEPGTFGMLRVAAYSGDTISIDSGKVLASHQQPRSLQSAALKTDVVPADYSPRDYFHSYRVPAKKDLLLLNRLSLRDLFFARSIIQQEHPGKQVTVRPSLFLDDSLCTGYSLTDFSLYNGKLDSVPDSLRYNWFFWDRMEEYLFQKHDTRKVMLLFTILEDGTALTEYRVRDDYYFLLADNRKTGLDSRYTGPVRRSSCIGTAGLVLWSHGANGHGKKHFRFNRLGKIVR